MKSSLYYKTILVCLFAVSSAIDLYAQKKPLSEELATAVIDVGHRSVKWDSEMGILLEGMDGLWKRTANGKYFQYIQKSIDSVNHVKSGRSLLTLYKVTEKTEYFKAATLLWEQLKTESTIKEDSFSFYAEYAALVHEDKAFDDIANQLIDIENPAKTEGNSSNLAALTVGRYAMALVDVLDYFPEQHPKRKELIGILGRLFVAIAKYQIKDSDLQPSASSMFVYTIAKSVRMGYLSKKDFDVAKTGYERIQKEFIEKGARPGAFLLAANEMERAALPKPGFGKIVMLDSYFNNEVKKDQSGQLISWHYKWDERSNGGFSMWGGQFEDAGFKTRTLYTAPTAGNLKGTSVYIIVDPDTKKEADDPKFIEKEHIDLLTNWVKAGGILVLMANDTGNVELEHFNHLVKNFGVQFNLDSKGKVTGDQFEMGRIMVPTGNTVFKTARQLYIKEFSSLSVSPPAKLLLKDKNNDNVMAVAKLGKGTVIIIGDPWLYNEYVDGRKLPAVYDNFKAGMDLVIWIAGQIPAEE